MLRVSLIVGVLISQVAFGQQFNGSFVDAANGVTINLQRGDGGVLQGVLIGPNGQWQLQGNSQQSFAAGVVQSQQGFLGFQAQLSQDGQVLQVAFYELDANGNAVGQGQQLMLQRQGAAAGGMPGAAMPGAAMPGAQPGASIPGGQPGWPPPPPGAVVSTTPPGQAPVQPAGRTPGAPFGAQPTPPFGGALAAPQADWSGTFSGNDGLVVLSVQAGQGGYVGYLQDQGQRYQFEAHLDDETLHGQFMANGATYEFWVDRQGADAMLSVGDTTFWLTQISNQATP